MTKRSTPVRVHAIDELSIPAMEVLLADLQRFLGVERVDPIANRQFLFELIQPESYHRLLGASRVSDERLLGFIWLTMGERTITGSRFVHAREMFVTPEARRKGVGNALLSQALATARDSGHMWLEWTADPKNFPAQQLFGKFPGLHQGEWHILRLFL